MTIGFGGLALAPAAGAADASSGSGSPITSTKRFESGDHSIDCRRPLKSVNCIASPPPRSSNQIWLPLFGPGLDDVNARYFPSGLQRGDVSLSGENVIC